MNILNEQEWLNRFKSLGANKTYRAMYSTLWQGIVTDPALMLVPIDDHMVHRGDGVFEAARFNTKKIYLLDEHLQRLLRSADAISMKAPKMTTGEYMTVADLHQICTHMQKISGLEEGILRIFLGRGGGDFSPNPYSTTGTELHIVATEFNALSEEKYTNGASMMISALPVKLDAYARIKSLNYLPNVLMKKESLDKGFDFSVGLTVDGKLAEGPTENILLVTDKGWLVAPNFNYTLRGTTLVRTMDLAGQLVTSGQDAEFSAQIRGTDVRDVLRDELMHAREVMMVGTTLGILPVTRLDQRPIGSGQVGPIAKKLRQIFNRDLSS